MSNQILDKDEKIYLKPGVIFFIYNGILHIVDLQNKKIIKMNRKIWPLLVLASGISRNKLMKIVNEIYGLSEVLVKKALKILEDKKIITTEDLDLRFKKFIESYLDDIRKGRKKRRIYIEITTTCNAKCVMCYNMDRRQDIQIHEWLKILDYIPPSLLIITGGEPFVRRDLMDVLRHGADRGHEYFIITNGTLIDEEIVQKMLKIKDNIIRVRISVHGATSDTHDDITCIQGSYEKLVQATKLLVENGFDVEWTTTVNKINFNEIYKIIEKARKLGVKYFSAYPVDPMGRCLLHPDILLSATEKAELQLTLSKLRDEYSDIIVQEDSLPEDLLKEEEMLYPACKVGLGSFMILSNGDVAVCPAIQLPAIEKVNILEAIEQGYSFDQFEQMLYQKKFFKRLLSTPLHKYTSCGRCGLRYVCKGACRGRAFQYTNDILGCDLHIREMIIEYLGAKVRMLNE